jgi:DNA end-binding protein Ku
MAPRPSWRGYLKLSLVTCPVAMLPATSEAEKVRFHTLNRATGNSVHASYVDAETGKPVGDEDQVKRYEREDGEYVMLEDEELDAVALESTRTIDIECFVPANSIGWIWYDAPHYLVPDDKVGEEAFSVIRGAMVKSNTRAISRVVLYHRERAVLLEPRDKGIVLWTLRYGDEVRDEATQRPVLQQKKGLTDAENILDRAGPLELSANDFQMNLAAEVIAREGIRGEQRAIDINETVGARVRKVIEESGSPLPEDLPLELPIKEIETRVKAGNKIPKPS